MTNTEPMSAEQLARRVNQLADVLRAEARGQDLHEDENGDIVVCAMRRDGSLYQLGIVSSAFVLQNPSGARYAIGKIKFLDRAAEASKEQG